jgi:uncharacterized protein
MRRRIGLAVFLLLYGSVVASTHFYLVLRLVLLPQMPSPAAEIVEGAIALLGLVLFCRPVAERFLSERTVRALSWPAFVWMGASFLLLTSLLASDALLSLAARAAWAIGEPPSTSPVSQRMQATIAAGAAFVLSTWALVLGLQAPRVRRLEVLIPSWPSSLGGFRIVQLSDVHIGPLLDRRFAARLVGLVNALAPDLVAITGDLVDGSVEQLATEVEPLRSLQARHGVFFVTGNHDYFSRVDPWLDKVRELGFRTLRNERVRIGDAHGSFDLAGVDDRFAHLFGGDHGEDLLRALEGRDGDLPVVLLAHNPNVFDEAARLGVDLQLSGHTHGGQIWPFQAIVRLVTRYVAGEYRRGRSTLYVTRGTGFWGPPMRLFQSSEITEITLRPNEAS